MSHTLEMSYPLEELYHRLIKSLDQIEQKIFQAPESENKNFKKVYQKAHELVNQVKSKAQHAFQELERNGEWKTFTIAFYGETNAGKSTIIESLRIYFNEATKLEQQSKLVPLLQNQEALEKDYQLRQQEYSMLQTQIEQNQTEIQRMEQNLAQQEAHYQAYYEALRILQKLRYFLFGNPKKQQLLEAKKEFEIANQNFLQQQKENQSLLTEKQKEISQAHTLLEEARERYTETLEQVADGAIIGDGRSDFTRQTTSYHFTTNNQEFAILDVPGIEGSEKKVISEIKSATQKAHAIFYITPQPTPPQTGDKQKGILEKIQDHLGSQTEVYVIYNKRMNNPRELENTQLITEGEKSALQELDKKMKEVLQKHYIGLHNLSAQIAFYALAQHLIPDSRADKQRKKFLEKYSKNDLLQKSDFKSFTDFLTNDLVKDTKEKIKESNTNKAKKILQNCQNVFQTIADETFENLYQELKQASQEANEDYETSFQTAKSKMHNQVSLVIDRCISRIRQEVYEEIERDISDDKFKKILDGTIKNKIELMQQEVPQSIQNTAEKFQQEIKDIHSRFIEHSQQAIHQIEIKNFEINQETLVINLSNNLDTLGLFGGIFSAGMGIYSATTVINSWNPVGWTLIAWGAVSMAVTGIIEIAKPILKYFFKKSEQKKATDNKLKKVESLLKDQIQQNIFKQLKKAIESHKQEMQKLLDRIATMQTYIKASSQELKGLENQL